MSKTRDTGFLGNVVKYDANGNVTIVNGATTLLSVSSSGQLTVPGDEVITGSLTVLGGITGAITGSATSASYAANTSLLNGSGSGEFVPTGSFNTFSSSILTYTGSVDSRLGSLEITSGSNITRLSSIESTTGSLNTASGSAITRLNALEVTSGSNITRLSALETASGSAITRLNSIESKTGSYATTGSNTFDGGQYLSSSFNPTGFSTTASLYTDGGLRVTRDAYISGTLYLNNVTVFGTQSVAYISSSQLNIGTNLITVNTDTPSIRFGGLAVYDSGSTGLTGSLLWDSQNNHWVYSNPSGSSYSGGMFISGPRTSTLGSETGTTSCMLLAGQGGDHLTSSMIYHSSTVTCIPNTLIGNIGCFATSCAASFIGGTMSGTTIYGSTAICSPVGKFTSCLDLGGALTGTSATFSGNGAFSGVLQVAPTTGTGIIGVGDNFGGNMNAGIYRGGLGVTTSGNYLNIGGYDGVVVTTGAAALGSQTVRLTIASTGATTFLNSFTTSDTPVLFLSPNLETNQSLFLQLGKNISSTYNSGEVSFKYVGNGSTSNMVSLGFYGAGQKLNVLGNGNVGIGITPGYKLDINNGASGVVLNLEGTNAYGAETGILMSAGRAKISGFLETSGGTPGTSLRFYTMPNEGSVTERMRITSGGDTRFIFRNSSSEVMDLQVSTETASPSKSKISLLWYGSETTSIKFRRGDDSTGGNLEFWTQPTGGSITQRMSILSSGNIGIGQPNPQTTLEVNGGNTYFPAKIITISGAEATRYNAFIGLNLIGGSQIGMSLGTRSNNTEYINTLNLYNGTVGIGTTTPQALFDVADSSSNTLMLVRNTSTADTTGKNAMYGFWGTDTVGTPKAVGGMQAVPNDGNWVNGLLYWYVRGGDGQVLRMSLSSGGALVISGALTQNGSPSDINLKENLVKITSPLEKISQINGYNFEWKEGTPARGNISNIVEDAGVIAQEIEKVMPEIVRMSDNNKVVNYNGLIALLIESTKELKTQNDSLQAQIEALKAQIETLDK